MTKQQILENYAHDFRDMKLSEEALLKMLLDLMEELETVKKKVTFSDYLRNLHAEQYRGTDDDMWDDYVNWYAMADPDQISKYAEKWHELLVEGK